MSKSTFTRILKSGKDLAMKVQIIKLQDHELSGKQIQEICSAFGNHHSIAATPYRLNGMQAIAVNANVNVPCKSKKVEKNKQERLTVSFDFSEPNTVLEFKNTTHQQMLADLYFRNIVIRVNNTKIYSRISSDSHRIFYEKKSFFTKGDIGAFRRYELSEVIIDGVGIGVNIAVGTAFFSLKSVAQYYQEGREERLHELMDRMSLNNTNSDKGRERRGTLTFFAPNRIQTCYFERFLPGEDCSSSDPKTINGVHYNNLVEYYQNDKGFINPTDSVAVVSFKNLSGVRVPSKKLRVRIFNDKLPWELSNTDKIAPQDREYDINNFWDSLGKTPNGNDYNGFKENRFYKPSSDKCGVMELSGLVFGKGDGSTNKILAAPDRQHFKTYKKHFFDRKNNLDKYGCFYVPPTIEQEIYFPFPEGANLSEDIKERVAADICKKVSQLTRSDIDYIISDYDRHIEAAYSLKQEAENETGMVVFTFDDRNPAAYHQISSELSDWGLKRLTVKELRKKYRNLQEGKHKKWESYIDLIAYDIIQQMNCIPWVLTKKLNYDIHLAIDVSEKFKYYDLSLMVHNEGMRYPVFINHIHRKTDSYKETINAEFLEEGIIKILEEAQYQIGDTLDSKNMLIYRDGKDCKEEFQTIKKIMPKLMESGVISKDLQWDYVEYRKSMMKKLRIYDSFGKNAYNSLEGSFFDVHPSEWSIIATTGAGTLQQGTANPISIKNNFTYGNLAKIREDLFLTTQYNFSNPGKAQRLSLPLKRADEELQEKMAQEVKGLRIK